VEKRFHRSLKELTQQLNSKNITYSTNSKEKEHNCCFFTVNNNWRGNP